MSPLSRAASVAAVEGASGWRMTARGAAIPAVVSNPDAADKPACVAVRRRSCDNA